MLRHWPVVLLLTALGCTDATVDEDDVGFGGKDDRDAAGFSEVDATHSTLTFRRYLESAIRRLERHPSELAQLTARAIRDRRVHLDELVDLTCWDFERARADLPAAGLTSADYHRLHDRGSSVAKALTDELDGYMWSNRIYVSRGQATNRLAATLVHEVNHVINRSEVGYYDDLPTSAFLHEYRAFYSESLFDPEEYAGIDLVDHVIENYELDRSKIPAAVLREPLSPLLLPDAAAWQARRIQDDERDLDADCPANR